MKTRQGRWKLAVGRWGIALLYLLTSISHLQGSPFFKLNDTSKKILIFMSDSAAPASGKTGLTVAVRVSKNGAAFAAGGGSVAELEGGWYAYTPASGDMDTLGSLAIRATAAGAVDYAGLREVVAFDPFDSQRLGLAVLPSSSTLAVTPTIASTQSFNNTGQTTNLPADLQTIKTQTVTAAAGVTFPSSIGTSTYAGADTSGTTTLLSRLTSTRAGLLDNLDAAISSRSTYAGADTSGTTTLLARLTIARAGYLDNISVAPPTVAQIWSEPLAGYTTAGTAGKTLSSAGSATDPLNVTVPGSYADHTVGKIISRLDIAPPAAFVVPVPGAPADVSLCRVYGYIETLTNQPAANVTIVFKLVPKTPEKSDRIISARVITITTDSQGRISDGTNPYIDLQRNDHLTPAGSTYQVSSPELGFKDRVVTLAADTFDLSSVVP